MSPLFEAIMVICFGVSWPISILNSVKAKTAKGKSIVFLILILIGYVFGIASKLIAGNLTYVLVFYIINFIMVAIDAALYVRNSRLDKKRAAGLIP